MPLMRRSKQARTIPRLRITFRGWSWTYSRGSRAVSFLSLSTDVVTQAYPDQPLAVSVEATVGEVVGLMKAQRSSCVLICGSGDCQGQVEGIFTERDALRWMAEGGSPQMSIREAMTAKPEVLHSKNTVGTAIEIMAEGGYRHLPIVDDDGTPLGVAAARGIVHYLVDHFPQTIYTLPPEPGKTYADREGA
jgi:CBS domain-containing protein